MGLTIVLDDRALHRYLGAAEKKWPDAADRALSKIGRLIFEQSQAEVPVGETHKLSASGVYRELPRLKLIIYGQGVDYARIVHFRRRVRFRVGKRLFVSRPLAKGKRLLPSEIETAIQEAMDNT